MPVKSHAVHTYPTEILPVSGFGFVGIPKPRSTIVKLFVARIANHE